MNKIKALWRTRKDQVRYAKWLYQYSKPYLGRILLRLGVYLVLTILSLVMVEISKVIIDNATFGNNFIGLIVLYFGLILAQQVLQVGVALMGTVLMEKFSFGIRKQLYEKIINSHWMDVKKYHTGDLMTRLTTDAGNIADGIVNTIPAIIQLGIELLAVFLYLFYYSPVLAICACLIAPIAAISSWWLGKKLRVLQVKVQESEASYRSFIQESLANLLVVKAFANEKYYAERLAQLRDERFHWVFKKTKMNVAASTTMSMSFQIGYIVAFAYGALQISKNVITYGTMSVFLTLVNRVQSPIITLAQQIPKVVSIFASAERVIELQNIPLEEKMEQQLEAKNIGVRLEDMSFGYTQEKVLEAVSLDIKPGEFVAIVGESGIGKTTLIRIIMAFMENITGHVSFYNERGECEKANAGMRKYLSYVPQGNTLFSGTVRENIRTGKLDATEEEIWEALKLSSGYDFVKSLPNGLDTVIGERGHGLSEGQAQRIAIARAFVRKAPFLILDEATSSLDEETELSVLQGLQQLQPKPTCLIITHRKSILKYCDREIKIENKTLQESDHVLL